MSEFVLDMNRLADVEIAGYLVYCPFCSAQQETTDGEIVFYRWEGQEGARECYSCHRDIVVVLPKVIGG